MKLTKNMGKSIVFSLAMLLGYNGFAKENAISTIQDLERKIVLNNKNFVKTEDSMNRAYFSNPIPIGENLYAKIIVEDDLSTKENPDSFQLAILKKDKKGKYLRVEYFIDQNLDGMKKPNPNLISDTYLGIDPKTAQNVSRGNLLYSMNDEEINKLNELYANRLKQTYTALNKNGK